MKKLILIFVSIVFISAPVFFAQGNTLMDVEKKDILFSPSPRILPIEPVDDGLNTGILPIQKIISDETAAPDQSEEVYPDRESEAVTDTGDIDSSQAAESEAIEVVEPVYSERGEDLIIDKEESLPVAIEADKKEESSELEQDKPVQNIDKLLIEKNEPLIEEIAEADELGELSIDFSKIDVGAALDVCNLQNGCSGDMGATHWVKEAAVYYNDYRREIRFFTEENKYKQGILQVANFSFEEYPDTALIHSQGISGGISLFDFSIFSKSKESELKIETGLAMKLEVGQGAVEPKENQGLFNKTKNVFSGFFGKIKNFVLKPFKLVKNLFVKEKVEIADNSVPGIENIKFNTYYLRVIPTENGRIAGQASNQVKVSLKHPEEASDITIYKPAKLYEVKIKSFDPIRAPEPGVCNGAMILENDWTTPTINGPVTYKAGERVCPKPYKGVGEEAWYESLWNFAKNGVDWISEAYQRLKKAVVDGLADVACGGNDYCRQAISTGLDIGLAAMGLPPTLPNFDQLVDEGFDYLAGEIAVQAGCFDPDCKEKIEEGLRMVLEGGKNNNPYCKNDEEAHRLGYEPLCLPDNVKAHIDPLGTYRQAKVVLEVKRTELDGSSMMGAPYRLHFNNYARNALPVGSWIHNIQPYGASVQITEPLQGTMFETKTIVLPEMNKGEVMNIPIILTPEEYWVPGHKEAMQGWSTVTYVDGWPQYQYDDWWKLYYGSNLALGAVIDGCDYGFGDEGCVISSDYMSVAIPIGLNP